MLDYMFGNKIEDMIYVLNYFVNYYSKNRQNDGDFIIRDIKDYLVFCAYKTSINLSALTSSVNQQYYDSFMAIVRIVFEILISVRAYKKEPEKFKEKILSQIGVEKGTHRKIDKFVIENIETKETVLMIKKYITY